MDKKIQIINAALQLFVEKDVQSTPMSAIAKAANTGMGTIYNYFPSKEDLINEIYIHIKSEQVKAMAVDFQEESIKKQFDHYYKTTIIYLINNPLHFSFRDQFHNSPIISTSVRKATRKSIEPVVEFLIKGQQQGIVKSINIDEMLHFLNGGLSGFVRWAITEKKGVDPELIDNQLKIAWDAIKQ
jgi:AcrR family transcriptional regulator